MFAATATESSTGEVASRLPYKLHKELITNDLAFKLWSNTLFV